jgi:hypothetical protein
MSLMRKDRLQLANNTIRARLKKLCGDCTALATEAARRRLTAAIPGP